MSSRVRNSVSRPVNAGVPGGSPDRAGVISGGNCTVMSRPWITAEKKMPPLIVVAGTALSGHRSVLLTGIGSLRRDAAVDGWPVDVPGLDDRLMKGAAADLVAGGPRPGNSRRGCGRRGRVSGVR